MRLRLMIRDRIFLWINERSTQIVMRLEEKKEVLEEDSMPITTKKKSLSKIAERRSPLAATGRK